MTTFVTDLKGAKFINPFKVKAFITLMQYIIDRCENEEKALEKVDITGQQYYEMRIGRVLDKHSASRIYKVYQEIKAKT